MDKILEVKESEGGSDSLLNNSGIPSSIGFIRNSEDRKIDTSSITITPDVFGSKDNQLSKSPVSVSG